MTQDMLHVAPDKKKNLSSSLSVGFLSNQQINYDVVLGQPRLHRVCKKLNMEGKMDGYG